MSDVAEKLKGLLGNQNLKLGSEWRKEAEEVQRRRASGEFDIEKIVPGEVVGDEESCFYVVREEFPLNTRHGGLTLGAALDVDTEHIAFAANDAELQKFDARTAVFVDAETTGLSGGTGTVAFLVGAGYFTEDAFVLEQCFMRDFDEEEAMLAHLDALFSRAETVVSYNGKSFDIPLLRTRFITNRIPYRLDGAMHLDLLYAARRFWKLRLQDCSLGNIEEEVLGIQRTGDVSSWEIPRIWLDYLRTRDARRLEGVFYHHKMDILSLVALTARISSHIAPDETYAHEEDELSIVRLHYKQKRFEEVIAQVEAIQARERAAPIQGEYLEMMAGAYKRLRRWEDMKGVCETLLAQDPADLFPRLELAKFYEHRSKDLRKAERICQEALELLDTRQTLSDTVSYVDPRAADLQHRLGRIQRKLKKA